MKSQQIMRYLWKSQAQAHTKSEMESQSGFALRWGITGVRRQRGCSGFCRPPDFDPIHRRSEIYSHRIDFPVLLSAPAVSSAWNTEHSWGGLPIFSQILFSSQISFVIECSAHLAELCNYKKSVAAEWEGRPHVSDIRQCNDQSNRWHGFSARLSRFDCSSSIFWLLAILHNSTRWPDMDPGP